MGGLWAWAGENDRRKAMIAGAAEAERQAAHGERKTRYVPPVCRKSKPGFAPEC
jgi:hypothetical protein